MAVDEKVPYGEAGIAAFDKISYGNKQNWQFGDTPALTTKAMTFTFAAETTLAFLSVLAADGAMAEQAGGAAADRANYVLAVPGETVIPAGTTLTLPVYLQGHFEQEGLVWDASYTTDAQKQSAFQGSLSPTIYVSKGEHDSDAIY